MASAEGSTASRPASPTLEQPRRVTALIFAEAPFGLSIIDSSSGTCSRREQSYAGAAPSVSAPFSASRLSRLDSNLRMDEEGTAGLHKRRVPRWICSLGCFCGGGKQEQQQRKSGVSALSQSGVPPTMARRSNASAAYRLISAAGLANRATSTACSGDSHLGPLPTRLHHPLDPISPVHSTTAHAGAHAATPQCSPRSQRSRSALTVTAPPIHFANRSAPAGSNNSHHGSSAATSVRTSGPPRVFSVATAAAASGGGTSNALGFSRASSMASYTSGITTTSRPSRWGLLANIVSAGLRSFTQLASVIEPNTGSLAPEAVMDLTRRASRLDMLRAVGQVRELSLVGSGSMGLVYRGRIAEGGAVVCVKYLVARGTDGMAAPATEGLLSRALVHPNIVVTFSWHVTKVTSDNFLDLSEALAVMATRETRGAAKRRGGGVGKGRRGGGGKRQAATTAASAAAAGTNTSSVPLYKLGSSLGACLGAHSPGYGCNGGAEVGSDRPKSPDQGSGGLTAAVLELVRSSAAAGGVSRRRAGSTLGSPEAAHPVLGANRSFTVPCRGGQQMQMVAPEPAPALVLACTSPEPQPGLVSPGMVGASAQRQSVRAEDEGTWSVRRGELLTSGGDIGFGSLAQQAVACDMTAGVGDGTAGWFNRESLSSHWLVSPNPSNHPHGGGGGGGGSQYGGRSAGGGGEGSLYGICGGAFQPTVALVCSPSPGTAAAAAAAAPPLTTLLSSPVSITGPTGRGRAVLMRAGSRLQFATTPSTQPSIPEDMQALDFMEYVSACAAASAPAAPPPTSSSAPTNDDALRMLYGITAVAGGGGDSCRSQGHAAGATAAPAAAAESVRGAVGGGDGTDSPFLLAANTLPSPSPHSPHSPQSPHAGGSCGKAPKGLLAAAIAAQGDPHASAQSPPPSVPGGTAKGAVGSPGINAAAAAAAAAVAAALHEIRPATPLSHPASASASVSTAYSRMTFSSRRLSSVAFGPILAHCSAPAPGDKAVARTAGAAASGGSGGGDAVPAGVIVGPDATSGCPSAGATASGSDGRGVPSPSAVAIAAMEAEAAKQEALERGWRTLQEIMQRLNAKPGDFLTRIVMEEADQGSLLSAVRSGRFRSVPCECRLRHVLLTALDIARGMAFLHSSNVIHGDLKPSNVLLCSDASDPRGFIAKVSDFGLSRIITKGQDSLKNLEPLPAGTVSYMAPETVSGSSCRASDVWSYAVVLWQLVTGELAPWPGLRNVQIMMGVMQDELRLTVPQGTYPPLAQLIESCLSHKHELRPSFDDIVQQLQAMLRDLAHAVQMPPPLPAVVQSPAHVQPATTPTPGGAPDPSLDSTDSEELVASLTADGPMGLSPVAADPVVPNPATAGSTAPHIPDAAAHIRPIASFDGPAVTLPDAPNAAVAVAAVASRPSSSTFSSSVPGGAAAAGPPGAATVTAVATHERQHKASESSSLTTSDIASCTGARSVMHPGTSTLQSSLTGTDVSLATAAASSNQLTNMSSSWANLSDRDHRGGAWQHAWHSSAWHLTTGMGSGLGFGCSSSHTNSRPLTASMGVSGGAGAMMQDFFYRKRISAGSNTADDMPVSGSDCNTPKAPHSSASFPAAACGGGAVSTSNNYINNSFLHSTGAAVNGDGNGYGGEDTGAFNRSGCCGQRSNLAITQSASAVPVNISLAFNYSDLTQTVLPPVHEESPHPNTTSSGAHTVMTHGSPLTSSAIRHATAGNAGERRQPESSLTLGSGCERRQADSFFLGSDPYGCGGYVGNGGGGNGGGYMGSSRSGSCGEATLPVMLQAGLIVLGARELVAGRSNKSLCSQGQRPGSDALSHLEDGSLGQQRRDEYSPMGTGVLTPQGGLLECRRSGRGLASGSQGCCQDGPGSAGLSGSFALRKSCSFGRGGR